MQAQGRNVQTDDGAASTAGFSNCKGHSKWKGSNCSGISSYQGHPKSPSAAPSMAGVTTPSLHVSSEALDEPLAFQPSQRLSLGSVDTSYGSATGVEDLESIQDSPASDINFEKALSEPTTAVLRQPRHYRRPGAKNSFQQEVVPSQRPAQPSLQPLFGPSDHQGSTPPRQPRPCKCVGAPAPPANSQPPNSAIAPDLPPPLAVAASRRARSVCERVVLNDSRTAPMGPLLAAAATSADPPVETTSKSDPPLPPTGCSWDWPLSRHERKARILMIDKRMLLMDSRKS